MTERHLRCEADGCHFCCCCASKYDRLGCLRRHVVWHIQNMFTTPLPPRNTILLLDELEEWEDKQNEENKDVTSSSCDEAKIKDRENFGRSNKSPLENFNDSNKVPKGARDPDENPLENFNDSNQKLLAEVPKREKFSPPKMATVKVPEGAHDPEEVETSANTQKETETGTEPTNAHGSKNPSYNVDKENVQGNDNPSQQPDESEVKKLALHMGLPPGQVPLTTVASTLHQFTLYRTSKEKWIANIRVDTGFVAFTRINTGLVAYSRIITDSTRIFDRGRRSGLDTMSRWSPSTAPSAGEGR